MGAFVLVLLDMQNNTTAAQHWEQALTAEISLMSDLEQKTQENRTPSHRDDDKTSHKSVRSANITQNMNLSGKQSTAAGSVVSFNGLFDRTSSKHSKDSSSVVSFDNLFEKESTIVSFGHLFDKKSETEVSMGHLFDK